MSTIKSTSNRSRKHLVKSTALISAGVMTSRILGFVRDVLLAHLLGTGRIAEAFFVAQRIPNMLRDLVGEGAANAAIVPVLTEYQQTRTKEQWRSLVNVLLAWSTIILTLLTVLGFILTPWIVWAMAPGFLGSTSQFQLTIDLTRIMFPYLILVALTAIQMGVLYTLNSFTAPAFSSCLLNIAMIISVWVASYFSWAAAYILAVGVVLGGIFQLLWQREALRKQGFEWKWPKKLYHEGMTKIAKLMVPRLWGSAVYQMNIFIDTLFASLSFIVGAGGIAAIYFANRLIQLPLGVFAYSMSNASLPSLSASAAEKNLGEFKETLYFSLKNLLFILLPCMVLFFFLSPLMVQIIFERGAFNQDSTKVTSTVLQFLSLGLPFFGASRILLSGFYALQDTSTPVKYATYALFINLFFNATLMFPLKIGGIALASSISGLANFLMLYLTMKDRLGASKGELKKFALRIIPCVVMMGAMMFLFLTILSLSGLSKLIVVGAIGVFTYLLCCYFMRVSEVRPLWRAFRAQLKKRLGISL